jgi:hypothetical protein
MVHLIPPYCVETNPAQQGAQEHHPWAISIAVDRLRVQRRSERVVEAAETAAWETGEGEWARDAPALVPDDQPRSVCTKGWHATRQAWKRLFPKITLERSAARRSAAQRGLDRQVRRGEGRAIRSAWGDGLGKGGWARRGALVEVNVCVYMARAGPWKWKCTTPTPHGRQHVSLRVFTDRERISPQILGLQRRDGTGHVKRHFGLFFLLYQ